MTQDDLQAWLNAYQRAWETRDAQAVGEIFSEDATYHENPFGPPMRGRAAIREYWTKAVVQPQEQISFGYEILVVRQNSAIVRWWASFVRISTKAPVKLEGIFLLTFASGNLCQELREWWMKKE